MASAKNHPTVECVPPLLAASAGPYPEVGSRAFDDIAKPDLFVGDKSRQANSMRRFFVAVVGVVAVAATRHVIPALN